MKNLAIIFVLLGSFKLFAAGGIEIQNPVIRLTPPGMTVTAIFLKINNNTDKDLKIIKVTGDFANSFELHNMEILEGKMKMRSIDSILLKNKTTTELKSGGLHLMVFGLKKPLKEGEHHKLKIVLDNKSEIEVDAKVVNMN